MGQYDRVPGVWVRRGGKERRAWYHYLVGVSCPFCCVRRVGVTVGAVCGCGAVVSRVNAREPVVAALVEIAKPGEERTSTKAWLRQLMG